MTRATVKILLVEDDEDDFILTRTLLSEIDSTTFEIDWETDFDRGLDRLCEKHYDACLVDYRLGDRDGIEFIRASQTRSCRAPLILMTGQGDHEVDVAAMEAGASDFLTKGQISASTLERSIRYCIQQRVSEQQRIDFIREQAARREAEAANDAKDQFLATLSHELRTPLNAILGWAQLFRMTTPDAAMLQQGFEAIERNAKAQAQLIEDLLDVSRIVSGKVRLNYQLIDLPTVTDAAVESVRLAAVSKNIELVRNDRVRSEHLYGDATRLQQIVWNLLTNAIKFTPAGGKVELAVDQQDGLICIYVRDTGQGIEADFLPHVFDRFRQADSSTTRSHTGLGLGLAIVRHLAELHGGRVTVTSDGLGRGSQFCVSLPQGSRQLADAVEAAVSPSSTGSHRNLAGVRVLVVDDEEDSLAFMSKALRLRGVDVVAVQSVEDAIRAFDERRPDIVVSDIAMPRQDGYSLIRQLRSRANGGANHPLSAIAITAHASQQDREKALANGFDAHLAKPIEPTQLLSVVAGLAPQGR